MLRNQSAIVTLALVFLAVAPAVWAQGTTRAPAEPDRGRYQSLFPDAPVMAAEEVPEDFPALFAARVPDAAAHAALGRAVRQKLMLDLRRVVRWEQEDFEQTPELIESQTAADQAWQRYMEVREQALQPLQQDPEYVETLALREELKKRIAEERFAKEPDPRRLQAMATLRLIQGRRLREQESTLLADNEQVEQARRAYVAAADELKALQQAHARRVERDPQVSRLREDVANANIAYVAANTYLDALLAVSEEALEYAYFLHRYDYKRYQTPTYYVSDYLFDRYGFGYGYDYGYR